MTLTALGKSGAGALEANEGGSTPPATPVVESESGGVESARDTGTGMIGWTEELRWDVSV